MNELCAKCQCETAKIRIKCALCDSWWHVECVSVIDLKSQEDIEAMDFDFYCDNCTLG